MQTNLNIDTAIVWSQPNCNWCNQAKTLLKSRNIPFEEKMIGDNATRDEFFAAVPGARSVPQIILNGKHVGGFQELKKALSSDYVTTTKMV